MSSKQEVLKSPVPGLGHIGWAVVWTQGLRDLRSCDTGHSYHSWELSSPRFLSPVSLWHNSESFTRTPFFPWHFQWLSRAASQLRFSSACETHCQTTPLSSFQTPPSQQSSGCHYSPLSLAGSAVSVTLTWRSIVLGNSFLFDLHGRCSAVLGSLPRLALTPMSFSVATAISHGLGPYIWHGSIWSLFSLNFCFQLLPILLCLMWTCLLIVSVFLTTLKSDHCLYGHCQNSCDYHLATAVAFHCLLTAIGGPDSDPGAHLWPELVVSESRVDTLAP